MPVFSPLLADAFWGDFLPLLPPLFTLEEAVRFLEKPGENVTGGEELDEVAAVVGDSAARSA